MQKKIRRSKFFTTLTRIITLHNIIIQREKYVNDLQFSQAVSLVFNKAARPILSLGITRLSMSSEPLELAIAS